MKIVHTEAQWSNYKLYVDKDSKISIQECGDLIPKFRRQNGLCKFLSKVT